VAAGAQIRPRAAAGTVTMPPLREMLGREMGRIAQIRASLRLVWDASPGWMLGSAAVLLLQSIFPPLLLLVLKRIIDAVGHAGPLDSRHVLWLVALAAAIAVAETIARAVATLVSEAQGLCVSDHIQQLLIAKSSDLDLAYFESPEHHDVFHRAQQDAPARALHLAAAFNQLLRSSATLFGLLILLLSFHWILVAALLACMVPTVVVRMRYARELRALIESSTALERLTFYQRSLLTTLEPAKEVRLFDLAGMLKEQFTAGRRRLRGERLAIARRRAQIEIATQVFAELAIFGSLAFIVARVAPGETGGLVIYFWALQFGRSLLNEAMAAMLHVYEDNLFLSDLFGFLRLEPDVRAPASPAAVPRPMRRGITLDHVSFRYPGSERPVLEDVSLEIRPGEKIALVGENGSGKTTLVKLVCRFYDPTGGTIRLDGTPLRDFTPEALRREIGVVFQDYMRYGFTARQNIWVGDTSLPATSPAIEGAAKAAGVDATIRRLPHGYETQLGRQFDGGTDLSIGEWQKIAIARAILRDSQIVILDEPTSALDAQAELEVFEQFARLAEGRTTLLISHRLSTVRMADRIYVLDRGRIIESGTHDELMQNPLKYAQLFDMQARRYR